MISRKSFSGVRNAVDGRYCNNTSGTLAFGGGYNNKLVPWISEG